MKVCFLTTSYPRRLGDYAGVFIFWLHRELVKKGIEVDVIAPGAPGARAEEVWEGVRVHRFGYFFPRRWQRVAYGSGILGNLKRDPWAWVGMPFFLLAFFLKALRVGRDCDLIHCFWSPTLLLVSPWAKLRKKKLVLTVLGSDLRSLPRLLNRWIFALADSVIASVAEIVEELEKLGVADYRVITLPVDETRFHRQREFSMVRRGYGLGGGPVVTFVARLDEFKDPLTFVRAVPEIRRQLPEASFFIVGDGDLRGPVEQEIARRGLGGVVHLAGFRGDVDEFLGVSHVFVALSPYENTWSNTIAEAMFMEVPCIITDAGYSARFFAHEENCLLIPPRNKKALAEAVVRLIRDPVLRARIARGGKELLKRHGRTIPEITRATVDLYRGLIGPAHLREGAICR